MPIRSKHPGVKLVRKKRTLADGSTRVAWVIRYKVYDPKSQKYRAREEDLKANYGYTTKAQAFPILMRISERLQAESLSRTRQGRDPNHETSVKIAVEIYADKWREDRIERMGPIRAEASVKRLMNTGLARFIHWTKERDLWASPLASLIEDDLKAYAKSVKRLFDGSPAKASSQAKWIGGTKTFLRWARKEGFTILSNDQIGDALETPKSVKPKPRALTSKEIARLFEAVAELDLRGSHLGARTKPLFPWLMLSLMTGARPAEVLRLRWQDVDFDRGWIVIEDTKTGRPASFPLGDSPCLLRFLEEYPQRDTFICGGGQDGRPQEGLQKRRLNRIIKASGVAFVPYHFRSTAVSYFRQYATGYPVSHAKFRFRHTDAVANTHYVGIGASATKRGATIESWYGCAEEIESALDRVLEHERKREFEARQ